MANTGLSPSSKSRLETIWDVFKIELRIRNEAQGLMLRSSVNIVFECSHNMRYLYNMNRVQLYVDLQLDLYDHFRFEPRMNIGRMPYLDLH